MPDPTPASDDRPAGLDPEGLLAAGLDDASVGAADIAEHFPQYEIQGLLGEGGMGVVYRARHRDLDRVVALKVLPPGVDRRPGFAERFRREARALARLEHPNIVRVYDFGETEGLYFLALEHVDGVTLRDLIRDGEMEAREALSIVPQICDAIQYAHDQGIVHRDIKPENVLVSKGGTVKLADFGLAKLIDPDAADPTLTRQGQVMGTLHYMAPEQLETPNDVDHRADIYSLGVVFYEMLTGELPLGRFDAPSQRVEVDVRLDAVVLRALEKQRDRRYQRAEHVKTAVHDLESAPAPVPAQRRGDAPRDSAFCSMAAWSLTFGLIALVLLLASWVVVLFDPTWQGIGIAGNCHLWALVTAVIGLVLGGVAWLRIALGRGALTGVRIAAWGTLGPLVLGPLLSFVGHVYVLAPAHGDLFARAQQVTQGQRHISPPEGIQLVSEVSRLWRLGRDQARHPADLSGLESVYSAADARSIRDLTDEQRERLRQRRDLGVPLLDLSQLHEPPESYRRIHRITLDSRGDRGVVEILANNWGVSFPIVRTEHGWRFHVGTVSEVRIADPALRGGGR